jgi:predicted alpha/beta-hydrolase family hydrolase
MPDRFAVEVPKEGSVSARWYAAREPRLSAVLILGHGAGADQNHDFLVSFADALAARGLDVVTFNFLYTEHKRGAPDRAPKLEATYRAVIDAVRARPVLGDRALFIGGKSMGGRIGSQVAAAGVDGLRGLVFLGYPLHPPKQPERERSAHLPSVKLPMLFVQGERDDFGTPAELAPILARLEPRPEVHAVAFGDHSLKVPKKAGTPQADVYAAAQDRIVAFVRAVLS